MADSKTNTEQEQEHIQAEQIQSEQIQAEQIQAEQIQVILRQTDYTYEEAREKLLEHKHDYRAVIRSYLKQGMSSQATPETKPLSMNQQIYKEIRSFMDEADQVKPSQ